MQFRIDNASDRAVYLQIIDQVKRDIALGRLAKEERLPTVRQLAQQLAINPNTIAKAYRQLEQEGIIVTRAGAGASRPKAKRRVIPRPSFIQRHEAFRFGHGSNP